MGYLENIVLTFSIFPVSVCGVLLQEDEYLIGIFKVNERLNGCKLFSYTHVTRGPFNKTRQFSQQGSLVGVVRPNILTTQLGNQKA